MSLAKEAFLRDHDHEIAKRLRISVYRALNTSA
jgi:hypothetical protein